MREQDQREQEQRDKREGAKTEEQEQRKQLNIKSGGKKINWNKSKEIKKNNGLRKFKSWNKKA